MIGLTARNNLSFQAASPAPAPKVTPPPASNGAAFGKTTGKETGGKVLPKEELNPAVLDLLKKY